jgi:hypothetical protein
MLTIITSIYLGALPVLAALSANYTDFDPWLVGRAALRWRRREGRYVPGPGGAAHGYVITTDADPDAPRRMAPALVELDLATLWEAS